MTCDAGPAPDAANHQQDDAHLPSHTTTLTRHRQPLALRRLGPVPARAHRRRLNARPTLSSRRRRHRRRQLCDKNQRGLPRLRVSRDTTQKPPKPKTLLRRTLSERLPRTWTSTTAFTRADRSIEVFRFTGKDFGCPGGTAPQDKCRWSDHFAEAQSDGDRNRRGLTSTHRAVSVRAFRCLGPAQHRSRRRSRRPRCT